ncbi:MAG: PKD domain-containing protein [Bacteroidales bacterium]|nr:PKD domain-containing protein [Bacteroidales bacterium]
MSNKDNIENIFKDRFESFKQTPASSVWTKIERKMLFKHFLKYKVLSFNLWNVIAVVAIASSAIIFTNKTDNTANKNSLENINEINLANKSEKSVILNSNKNYEQSSKTTIKSEKNTDKKHNTTNNESENQISDKENVEVNSNKLLKENYVNSESINEGQITVKLAEPHSGFSVSTESACEPAAISFLNTSENCDSYHWDFGNGETSSQKNPTFVFRTAGTFNVTLTVTSGRFSDLETKKITIYSKPNADFEIAGKSKNLFKNDEIQFSNNSTSFSKCIWNFGDKKTSSYTNPSHIYDSEGNFKVSLICISDERCADTAFLSNVFIQNPKYKISFPTAFSPDKSRQSNEYWINSSNPNTIFHPVINTEVSNYRLRIYNKYGALVFGSNNIDIGWNGFYKNAPSPTGVFVWECTGKFENGKLFKETGNVTLLYLRNQ